MDVVDHRTATNWSAAKNVHPEHRLALQAPICGLVSLRNAGIPN